MTDHFAINTVDGKIKGIHPSVFIFLDISQ